MDPSFHRALSEGFLPTHDDDQLTEPACKSDTPLHNPSYVPSCHLSPKTDTDDMPEHIDQASITFVDYIKSPDAGEIKDSDDKELYIIFLTQRHVKDSSYKLHLSLSLFNCYGDSDRGLVSHMEQGQNKRRLSDDVHVFTFTQNHRQYVIIDLKESIRQIAEITINNDIPHKVVNLAHVYLRRDWLLPNDTFQKFLSPLASLVFESKDVTSLDVFSAYLRPLSQIPLDKEVRYQHADMGLYFDKNSAQSDLTHAIKINSQSSQRFSNKNEELSKSALVEIETQTTAQVKQNSDKEAQIYPLTEDAFTEMNWGDSEIDKKIEKRTQDVACEASDFVEEKEEQNVEKLLVNSEIQTEYGILSEISKEDKGTCTTTDLLEAGRQYPLNRVELSEKEIQTIQDVKENIDKEVQFSPLTLEIGIGVQIDPDYDSSAKTNREVQDFGCQVGHNSEVLDLSEDLNNMQGLRSNTSLLEEETQTLEVENQSIEKKTQAWCFSQDVETQTTDAILKEHGTEFLEITKDYLSTLYLKTMMKQILHSISIAMAAKEYNNKESGNLDNRQIEENREKEGDNEQYKIDLAQSEKVEQKQNETKAILVTPPNNILSTDISEVGTKAAEEEISQFQARDGSKKAIPKSKKELLGILKRLTFSFKVERPLGLPKIKNHNFANAAIQCFLNTPLLWPYFYRDSNLLDVKSKCEGNLAGIFGQLVKNTRSCLRNREELLLLTQSLLSCICNMTHRLIFDNLIAERAQKIGMKVQGDDMAFTTILLQGLNSDLTRGPQESVCRKLNFTSQNENPLKQKADKSFGDMLSKSNSIITDLFCGQLLKTTKCANCEFQSTESELFCTLPLTIKEKVSVDQALNEFTQEKHLQSIKIEGVSCPDHTLIGKTIIWRLPEVLILNLEGHQVKETLFHLNKTLDLANFVQDSDDESIKDAKYTLYGTVSYNHTLETYSADCLSTDDKKWYCYRDEEVTQSYLFGQTINEYRTIKALFYVKSSNFPRNDSRFIDRVIWHS